MEKVSGIFIGVFGSEPEKRTGFLNSVAKKSEAEGVTVYHRTKSDIRYTLMDDPHFPPRIQGYSKIASISSYAYYIFPSTGKLSPADGELAVLLDAFELPGMVELVDSPVDSSTAMMQLRGTRLAEYKSETRTSIDSNIEFPSEVSTSRFPAEGTLVYVDRAFTVKGVGTVVLGFVLSGTVAIHDELRPLPAGENKTVEVKGIQVNDVDYEMVGAGIRVGLSIKGATPEELQKCSWLDSGALDITDSISMQFRQSPFYRDDWKGKALHLQLPGDMIPVRVEPGNGGNSHVFRLQSQVPVWKGMKACLLDLNAKALRVVGSGTVQE